jgi:hypothetical protein
VKLLLLSLIAAVSCAPASAQFRRFGSDTRLSGYFGVGFANPVNPLGTRLDEAWSFAGGVGLTREYTGIMFDVTFADFGIGHSALLRQGADSGTQKYWSFTLDPVLHVNQRGPIDFYLTGGGGFYDQITNYRVRFSQGSVGGRYDLIQSNSIVKPGVDAGAGFSFNLGYQTRVKAFVEARFHHVFTREPGTSYIPVTIGVRF